MRYDRVVRHLGTVLLFLLCLLASGCGDDATTPTSTPRAAAPALPNVTSANGYTDVDAETFLTGCLVVDGRSQQGPAYCARLYECMVEAVEHREFVDVLDRLLAGGLPAATTIGKRPITGCYMSAVRAHPALVETVHGEEIQARFQDGCVSPLRTQQLADASAERYCTRAYACLTERLTFPGIVRVSFAGVRLTKLERSTIQRCQRVGARGVPGVQTP